MYKPAIRNALRIAGNCTTSTTERPSPKPLCKQEASPAGIEGEKVWNCEPFFPLQHSKAPRTLNLSKICPSDCFWESQSGGLEFVKNLSNFVRNYRFSNFGKFLTNSSPPDWDSQKQSLGQILDKFGFRGVFECCKGKKGSQVWKCSGGFTCLEL